jgi:hypothetical protein
MVIKEPKNLFLTTSFYLIILGAILYSKPIIVSIIERGFNADRGFDLAQGLVLGAIATKKRLDLGDAFTPTGILGPDRDDIIKKQLAQVEELKKVANIGVTVSEVSTALSKPLGGITVAELTEKKSQVEQAIEDPFKALENIKL